MSSEKNLPVLAYWDVRCLAEHIRLMFVYLGVEYTNKHYLTDDAPTYERKEWKKDKYDDSLGFEFPNVPYLIDGDLRLTESWAITRYLARKYKVLFPNNAKGETQCDMLQGVIEDLRHDFWFVAWQSTSENFLPRKEEFFKKLIRLLDLFSKYLTEKRWLIGEQLTFVDFALFELLDQIKLMFPNFDENCPKNVREYLLRFESLPAIKAYRTSSRFKALPVNSKYYYWGGSSTLPENNA